jgi:hypothetical protein
MTPLRSVLVVLTTLPQPVLLHGVGEHDASRAVQSLRAPAFCRGSGGFASERGAPRHTVGLRPAASVTFPLPMRNHSSGSQGDRLALGRRPGSLGPAMARAVLLVDGECALCSRLVHFLGRRDSSARLRFGTLQSAAGLALLRQHGQAADLASAVLIEYATAASDAVLPAGRGTCSTHSAAALR